MVEWEDRPAQAPVRERAWIGRAGARRRYRVRRGRDRIVGAPMRNGRLDADEGQSSRLDPLAAQLAEIEGRRLPARKQDYDPIMTDHCAGTHVDPPTLHGREMT